MLEHFSLVDVDIVPFPYGEPVAVVTGTGTTVAVLITTTAEVDETAATSAGSEETAPDEPESDPAEVGAEVSV
jgi:hypothetical protein